MCFRLHHEKIASNVQKFPEYHSISLSFPWVFQVFQSCKHPAGSVVIVVSVIKTKQQPAQETFSCMCTIDCYFCKTACHHGILLLATESNNTGSQQIVFKDSITVTNDAIFVTYSWNGPCKCKWTENSDRTTVVIKCCSVSIQCIMSDWSEINKIHSRWYKKLSNC